MPLPRDFYDGIHGWILQLLDTAAHIADQIAMRIIGANRLVARRTMGDGNLAHLVCINKVDKGSVHRRTRQFTHPRTGFVV